MSDRAYPDGDDIKSPQPPFRQIVFEAAPILHVTHDSDNHGWQFLGLEDARVEDASVVCLSEILLRDPTIRDIADLPSGWHAWRRYVGAQWTRAPNPREELGENV